MSLTTSKMQPFAMQVSLWDLLFFTNSAGEICTRYIQDPNEANWKCNGYELPHNIIVLDEKMYLPPVRETDKVGRRILRKAYSNNTETEIILGNLTTFEKWSSFGFDMSLPWFDVRSKPLFIKANNVSKYVTGGTSTELGILLSSIQPEKLASSDFYYIGADQPSGSTHAAGFKIWDKDAAMKPKTSYDFYIRSALKPNSTLSPNTWDDYPDPWYIATEDDWTILWENSLSNKNPGTSGADIILCNKDTSFEKRFIIPESGFSAYNGICLNFKSQRVWKNFLKYYSAQNDNFDPLSGIRFSNDYVISSIDPILNYLIKHCYIWFKCAFFADYVDYKDFNQSLNEQAQVAHKDLILGKGNFKRYEELYSKGEISVVDKAKRNRPYFPAVTPIKDLVRNSLLLESDLVGNKNQIIENIINDADSPDSNIGALPIEPFEDVGKNETSPNFTTGARTTEPPPIWFDPESRKKNTDYNDFPILIGKDGNLITAGRVLSPTIDELWQTIKELIAGKKADSANNTLEDFGGYPRNTNINTTIPVDTRLTLPTHKFRTNTESEKLGDPTRIRIQNSTDNPDNIVYRVTSWINNPDTIIYNVINELKLISNEICSTNPNLELIVNKIESLPKPEVILKEYLDDTTPYSPMNTIPSLRELEGIIRGIRWNLSYYIKFMMHHAVYTGPNGKSNSDNIANLYNKAGGTSYLLHKNAFNENIQKPKTVYDERINRDIIVEYGEGINPITGSMFGNNNQDMIPAHTVFMSAAGTWQSVSQCMNLRIRDDEVW